MFDGFQAPASVVICSEESGSRTIVHHNGGLPELTLEMFQEKLNLKDYDWIHFEVTSLIFIYMCHRKMVSFN